MKGYSEVAPKVIWVRFNLHAYIVLFVFVFNPKSIENRFHKIQPIFKNVWTRDSPSELYLKVFGRKKLCVILVNYNKFIRLQWATSWKKLRYYFLQIITLDVTKMFWSIFSFSSLAYLAECCFWKVNLHKEWHDLGAVQFWVIKHN